MREHALPLPPAHLLVALNGGTDNLTLLIALEKLGYSTQTAHKVDHLRGEQDRQDEHFIKEPCPEHGISLHIEHFGTRLMGTL